MLYLHELSELLNEPNCLNSIILPNLELVIEMIEKNIFRPFPVLKQAVPVTEGLNANGDDDMIIDPSWDHYQVNNIVFLIKLYLYIANLRIFSSINQ